MVKQNANDIKVGIDEYKGKKVLSVINRIIGDTAKDTGALVLLEDGEKVFISDKNLDIQEE